MIGSQKITEQDLSKIRERINLAGKKRIQKRKRAGVTATFGHIGFCLGLFPAGIYCLCMLVNSQVEKGVVILSEWYASIGQTIRGIVPEFIADNILEFLFMAAIPLTCSFVFALLGKIFGLFASGNYYSLSSRNAPPRKQAEKMLEDIERMPSGYSSYDDYYPSSDHMINLYNFFPWLFFAAGLGIGVLSLTSTDPYMDYGPIALIVLLFLGPIALLWRFSAIINSVFYRGSSGVYTSTEKKQLEDFIAQCDKEEQEKKEQLQRKQRAERLKKAEELYQRAIAGEGIDLRLLRRSADMEDPNACLRYGMELLSGLDPSLQTRSEMEKRNQKAASYFKIPAEQGNKEAEFYWLVCRCQYESGDIDHWEEILHKLRQLKANGHVPSNMRAVCDNAIEGVVGCINDLESRSYTPTYSTSSYTPSYSSYSQDKGLNTYMTDRRNGQTVYYKDGQYVNEDGDRVPLPYIEE